MAECFIVRRGGQVYQLPVLNSSYPQNATVVAAASGSATFTVQISQPGTPAEYTYQWYKNGSAISGATGDSVTLSGLTSAASHTVYCVVTNKAGSVTSRVATLTVKDWKPAYTYTGSATLVDDGNYRWRIKFLTSGTLTFSSLGNSSGIDVFLVGGGGGTYEKGSSAASGGGGGGYTKTDTNVAISTGTTYTITVGAGGTSGADGGTTSAFGLSVSGGKGVSGSTSGGNGGSGGAAYYAASGGSNGGNGGNGGNGEGKGGTGQGTTTREFGETSGTLYAGGGACAVGTGSGGSGGGGSSQASASANTGGGAGGSNENAHSGGSGIVVIRNHQ